MPLPDGFRRQLFIAVLFYVIVAVLALAILLVVDVLTNIGGTEYIELTTWMYYIAFLLGLISISVSPGRLMRLSTFAGLLACGIWFASVAYSFGKTWMLLGIVRYPGSWCIVFLLNATVTFGLIGCEADRMLLKTATLEKTMLRNQYTGQACDASSSNAADKVAIMQEIEDNAAEDQVNDTISVILRSGMSTTDLRTLAAHGIIVDDAGHFRRSLCSVCIGFWLLDSVFLFAKHGDAFYGFLAFVDLLAFALWIWICSRAARDVAAFGFSVCLKLQLLPSLVVGTVLHFALGELQSVIFAWFHLPASVLTLMLSALGPGKVVHLPIVGRTLTRFILASNWRSCFAIFQPHREDSEVAMSASFRG
jgi:hypothetical protein